MNKVHWIRDDNANTHPRKIITHCGIEGWHGGGSEFVTAVSHRFDAVARLNDVNCGRCLKSYERISNGPWGCKRR